MKVTDPADSNNSPNSPGAYMGMRQALRYRTRSRPAGEKALRIVSIAEPAACAYRVLVLLATLLVNDQSLASGAFLSGLVVMNATLVFISLKGRGPLARGAPGVAFEIVHALVAVGVIGFLLPRRTYFAISSIAPLGVYPSPSLALLTIYPRRENLRSPLLARLARGPQSDLMLPVAVLGLCLIAALGNGYAWESLAWGTLLLNGAWLLLAVLIGYVVWYVGVSFAAGEAELVRRSYQRLERWMHSELRGDIAVLTRLLRGSSDLHPAQEALRGIDLKIREEGLQLLLELDVVSVAAILSHHVKRFRDCFEFARLPQVGAWEISRDAAHLLDRCLGDLLSNAANAQATRISIDLKKDRESLVLVITDDGPGFSDNLLLEHGSSLASLRSDLVRAGGLLSKLPAQSAGSSVIASIPVEQA